MNRGLLGLGVKFGASIAKRSSRRERAVFPLFQLVKHCFHNILSYPHHIVVLLPGSS
jgi:hypothetical protein